MKNILRALFFILSVAAVPELPASELTTAETLFVKALNEDTGYYAAAAEFARLLDENSTDPGVLLFNIGNALFLDNDLISALAAYSGALEFRPADSDYLANRNLILKKLERPIPVPSGRDYIFHAPIFFLGLGGSRLLLLVLLIVSLLSATIYLAVNNEIFKSGSMILLILAFLLSVSIFTWENQRIDRAVVRTDESTLHVGDSPLYAGIAALKQGTELRILEERAGWYRVRTLRTQDEQSLQGWLDSGNVLKTSELIDSLK